MKPHPNHKRTVKRYYGIALSRGGVVSTYHHTGPKPLSIGTKMQVEVDTFPLDGKIVSRIFEKPKFETKPAVEKPNPAKMK